MKIKIITLILITILLNSCENNNTAVKDNVITSKAYVAGYKYAKLPQGICYYAVNGQVFQDSCNKYSVGDTIKLTK